MLTDDGGEFFGDDQTLAILLAFHNQVLNLRIDGDGCVRDQSPRRSGPDQELRAEIS